MQEYLYAALDRKGLRIFYFRIDSVKYSVFHFI